MLSVSRLSLAAAVAALALLPALPAMAQAIGVNAVIRNQVRMKTAAESTLRPAVLRGPVHIGDSVVSGPASTLQVLLKDKSTFTVGANARMTFDRFVYDPDRGTGEMAASVAKGAFRFMSGKSQANARKTITTPVASIGIRGTLVDGVMGADALGVLLRQQGLPAFRGNAEEAMLVVLRGPAKTTGADKRGLVDVTSSGRTAHLVRPGQAVAVFGGKMYGPFQLSDEAFDLLDIMLGEAPLNLSDRYIGGGYYQGRDPRGQPGPGSRADKLNGQGAGQQPEPGRRTSKALTGNRDLMMFIAFGLPTGAVIYRAFDDDEERPISP